MGGRGRWMGAAAVALAVVAAGAPRVGAIGGGVPDAGAHPAAGLLALEDGGRRLFVCSGWYAGPRAGDPSAGVFVTAGHCLSDIPASASSRLWVTFEQEVEQSEIWPFPVEAASWHRASGHASATQGDYGVVLLEAPVALDPIRFPAAGRLDDLRQRGGLRPETRFDNVGYGAVPSFKEGQTSYAFPDQRMLSSSRYSGLTPSRLELLMNSDVGDDTGGVCFFDSGGPVLEEGSRSAVAMTAGGDARCRAHAAPVRLDIADARAFYRDYLELP